MALLSSLAPVVYVQISPDKLTVRNARSGQTISEPPLVAIEQGAKPRILAVGAEGATQGGPNVEIVNPSAHPRSLVSDFTVGEQLLKAFLRRLKANSVVGLAPRVVMHPLGEPAGGFTQIEIRAFHEMALGAGASEAVVWEGRALTDPELIAGKFPAGGRVLS